MKTKTHSSRFVRFGGMYRPGRSTRTGLGLLSACVATVLFAFALALPNYDRAQAQTSVRNPRLAPLTHPRLLKPAPKQADVEATLKLQARDPSRTLPLWTFSVQSSRDGNTYSGVMVGATPFSRHAKGKADVAVPTYVVPLIIRTHTIATSLDFNTGNMITTPGDTTFDPTIADACLTPPNNVPTTLVAESPILQPAIFSFGGTIVGTTQYVDAFQRGNFWQALVDNGTTNHYHVRLNPATFLAPIVIDVPADKGVALIDPLMFGPPPFCPPFGIVDINWFDNYLDTTVIPALAAQGVNPSNLAIFPVHNLNVAFFTSATNLSVCCFIGYHSTTVGSPAQTYIFGDFDTSDFYPPGPFHDTGPLSHEVAEWMDDPFVTNLTPPWGVVQFPGFCQNTLEVGDPLEVFAGTEYPPIVMRNGFTYHLQELAFFSWFYGAPSIGVHGWFSNNGTFVTDAGPPCVSGP